MKTLILGTLLLSSTSGFAQNLDVGGLKKLLTTKKVILERVNAGMTKKMVTTSSEGSCNYLQTSTQSVLKILDQKVIILSKEKFQPQNSEACRLAGYTTSSENSILYYEAKPSLDNDLSDLDVAAPSIKSITKAGEIITMNLVESTTSENVTIKYDLTKPSFKNIISSQSLTYKTTIEDVADIDLLSVDLRNVEFCDNNDGVRSECTLGDYSDILY